MAKYAELTGNAFITVAGSDAGKFLHNTCTNDIMQMKRGDGLLAGFCGRDGKPRLLADIKKMSDTEYFLIFENTTPDSAVAFLEKYIITEKVAVTDETSRYKSFIILGVDRAEFSDMRSKKIRSILQVQRN